MTRHPKASNLADKYVRRNLAKTVVLKSMFRSALHTLALIIVVLLSLVITNEASVVGVGEGVAFASTSTGADRLAWAVDGVAAGAAPSLEWTADTVGPHAVALRADAGAWDDTHTEILHVHAADTDDPNDPQDPEDTGGAGPIDDDTLVAEGTCGCATGGGAGAWGLTGCLLLGISRRRGRGSSSGRARAATGTSATAPGR